MAAIAALLGLDARPADEGAVERLGQAMTPFGPDVTKRLAGPYADLAAATALGRNPSRAAAGDLHVIAIGRIDARDDLAADLALGDGQVRAMSEADLVLAAYQRWGDDLFRHLIGDFAFMVWDGACRRFLAATDPFGTRPVFYAENGSRLFVSDCLPALREASGADTAINEAFIADFLCLGAWTDPSITVHVGISRLPAGSRLAWSNGALSIRPYWRPSELTPLDIRDRRGSYAEEFRELFLKAVADRIPHSGPIGVQLSGGMDSTSVAAALQRLLGPDEAAERLKAHVVVFRDLPEEEGRFAGLVAERLGLPLEVIVAEDQIRASWPASPAWRPPQPGPIPELVPLYGPALAVARTGGALFTGLGGDIVVSPRVDELTYLFHGHGLGAPKALLRYRRQFGEWPSSGVRKRLSWLLRSRRYTPPAWVHGDLFQRVGLPRRVRSARRIGVMGGLDRTTSPAWTALLSMAASSHTGLPLEPCSPFMDVRLVRLLRRLPNPLLRGKHVLREAMAGMLPREVLQRPKTPLNSGGVARSLNPIHVSRLQTGIAAAPGLAAYVDLDRFRANLAGPVSGSNTAVSSAESLAYWLAHN